MTRILLFTGKGGVGKTTVAAATAVRAAARGRRVLVTSTDPAHSLADAFDVALSDVPTPVGVNLAAQQIDAQSRLEQHWRQIRDYLVELLSWGGVGEVQAEELAMVPGLDEIFSLVDLRDQTASGAYDLVVVDCAPTAETLRLLALPDALRWYVHRVVVPSRHVARAVRPVVSRVSGMPLPADRVFAAVERAQEDLTSVHALLQDVSVTSVRLVVTPERMVIRESLRTATSLSLFGYALDAVVVNRLLPDQISDPYLERWKQRHAEHLESVRTSFAPLPTLEAPLADDEPIGFDALRRLADEFYGDLDEGAILQQTRPMIVERQGEGYRLRLALPFASKDELELYRRGNELHVRVGAVKRTLPLPSVLRRFEVRGARLVDGVLDVRFGASAATATPFPPPASRTTRPRTSSGWPGA